MKTIIGVNGACGRMGQRIIQLVHEDKDLSLGAALEAANHSCSGKDIGEVSGVGAVNVKVVSTVPVGHRLDVIIDFSMPEGTMAVLPLCLERKIPLVVATTGHTKEQKTEIEAAAHHLALLMAPNMSLAVNLLMKLVKQAGETLKALIADMFDTMYAEDGVPSKVGHGGTYTGSSNLLRKYGSILCHQGQS